MVGAGEISQLGQLRELRTWCDFFRFFFRGLMTGPCENKIDNLLFVFSSRQGGVTNLE